MAGVPAVVLGGGCGQSCCNDRSGLDHSVRGGLHRARRILGIAWGIAAETANDLPAADQEGAGRLIDELIAGDPDPRGLILYWGAGLLWLAVALAVVAALKDTRPLGALLCLSLGAAVFSLGHAPPTGPIGMGLFLLGIAWAEFRPGSEKALPEVPARN